ncbi:MRPL49 [Bugula neritina]|uniref:Large ribosomal subunit protein mL49 n=1 Tax=Bugula neritina TaxID=10212 RepID=A0A7J7JB50_BUGNE|nr:MRPL49 [Bugula neritina]
MLMKSSTDMMMPTSILSCKHCSTKHPNYAYEVSKDPAEWKYVEHLLPKSFVPEVPGSSLHHYPTPSGWVPQQEEKYAKLPYYISRTKNHQMPIYIKERTDSPLKFTHIGNISGNIWALDADIRELLEASKTDPNYLVLTQVHEPGRFIRVKGVHADTIAQFLIDKGF